MKLTFDDGGRAKSKRPKQSSDCVVRAIAIAMNMDYDAAYDRLAERGRKSGRGTPKHVWKAFLSEETKAVKESFPAVKGQPRMDLRAFCSARPSGRFVVQMAGHLTAVIDGTVHDTTARPSGCVYAAWKI